MSLTAPPTGVWFLPDRPALELVASMVRAEELGLDEVWVGDEGPAREPFTVLAAAATATSRIRLAVGITNPYVRHPAVAATSMLTVGELSGGRAVLGVGAGGALSLDPFELTARHPVGEVRRFLHTAAAVRDGRRVPGFVPSELAIGSADAELPLFVGARGPRLNTLASELADGAFVAGMPPFRYAEVIGWARSVRPIDIALYPSVAFDEQAREDHRPEMIWSLLDSPADVRMRMGVDDRAVQAAAAALREGDKEPARAVISHELQEELMLVGSPETVGERLADLVREHRPASVGLALLQSDIHAGLDDAASAFDVMRRSLEAH